MRYRTILLIAILPAAWGQARHYRFNCAGSGAFPCQAEAVSLPATGSLTVNAVNGSVFVVFGGFLVVLCAWMCTHRFHL